MAGLVLGLFFAPLPRAGAHPAPLEIGNRLELFVDGYLVDRLAGASQRLHEPQFADVALRFDRPWEGSCTGYFTVINDGPLYRMYYVGFPLTIADDDANSYPCYAESRDGIHWVRPNLGLCEYGGRKDNNIILLPNPKEPYCTTFSPFLDERPGVPASERFKAVGGGAPQGLYLLVSADGKRWRKWRSEPVFTRGDFDSQNVLFWSEAEKTYVLYFRSNIRAASSADPILPIQNGTGGIRTVSRTTSSDLIHWSEPQRMSFGATPLEEIYTNATIPYYRAPQIYLAFPMRFVHGRRFLSDPEIDGLGVSPLYRSPITRDEVSDSVFMTSRGGYRYDRTFMEGFFRPGLDRGNWVVRSGMTARGVVPTGPAEISLYHERHFAQKDASLGRYTLRTDGFASIHGPYGGGEMVTKPVRVSGRQLLLNVATSAAGGVRVELQDPDGEPIPGFTLAESRDFVGDGLEQPMGWGDGRDLTAVLGRPVRLRFVLRDADLYALRFR